MACVLLIGAGPLAALMAAARQEKRQTGGPRNAASSPLSADLSLSAHSQTTSADQPSFSSAMSEDASRATLRPIFPVQ